MKRLSEDIKNRTFKQIYLLYGEEEFFKIRARANLTAALLPGDDGMNLTRFSEKGCVENKIIEICDTMPFFAERRVVVIENSGFFKEKHDRLAEYLKNIPEYLTVVFVERTVDKRNALYKLADKNGRAVEFSKLPEQDLMNWLLLKLKKAGKKIRKSEMELFLSYVGDNAGIADCEMEKLISYLGDRSEVSAKDIETICVRSLEDRIFEMLTDMTMGRRKKALLAYRDLLLMKEDPMRILYMMGRQYYQLLKIRELSGEGFPEREIAQMAGIHPYAVKKSMPVSRHYSEKELREILKSFVETEEDVKTGRLPDRLAVELMLIECSA